MSKKIIIILVLFILVNCDRKNNQNNNQIIVKGEIDNLIDSTYVVLEKQDSYSNKVIDYSYSKKKKFSLLFKNSQNRNGLYNLTLKDNKDSVLFFIDLWLDKKTIVLKGDLDNKKSIKVINDPINDILRDYRYIPDNYNEELEQFLKKEKSPDEFQEFFGNIEKSIRKDQIKYLFSNPNNLFSISEIINFKDVISKDSMFLFYKSLNKNLMKTKNALVIKEFANNSKIVIGEQFIDFEAQDIDGGLKKISDFKGKIILLDFWADWCSWCHVQNKKEFKYLNEKYKDSLVIISYSLDKIKDKWLSSSKKDDITWINLSNLRGSKDPVAFMYKVRKLPHSFLINKKGILIKEFIGYHRDSLIEKEIIKNLD